MTYTSNIPLSGQSLGVTRSPINSNFTIIQNIFDVNHFDFNVTNAGKHFFVEMPVVTNQTTVADECGLFCKDVGSSPAYANLFYIQESDGADPLRNQGAIIQMTSIAPGNNSNGYWTFLPGGLLLQWGTVASTSGNPTVTFPQTFSASPYNVQVTPTRTTGDFSDSFAVNIGTISATNFQIFNGSGGTGYGYYWMAIGSFTS